MNKGLFCLFEKPTAMPRSEPRGELIGKCSLLQQPRFVLFQLTPAQHYLTKLHWLVWRWVQFSCHSLEMHRNIRSEASHYSASHHAHQEVCIACNPENNSKKGNKIHSGGFLGMSDQWHEAVGALLECLSELINPFITSHWLVELFWEL